MNTESCILAQYSLRGGRNHMEDTNVAVLMKGITKVYPNGIAANQGVDFSVRKG